MSNKPEFNVKAAALIENMDETFGNLQSVQSFIWMRCEESTLIKPSQSV